jgi:hypothetical protein
VIEVRGPGRPPAAVTESSDLRLELFVRGREARTYFVRHQNGYRRIMRLLEADLPIEAHRVAAAGLADMQQAERRWPEDVA